jgi:hypothetical protein
MNEHRDGLAATKRRIGKMKRERTFAASWSAGKQMCPTVSDAGEPIVEQSNAAANYAANGLGLPSLDLADDEAGTMVEANASPASSATNPSIHVPRHSC